MKKRTSPLLSLALCSLFAACGGGDSHAVGTYKLDVDAAIGQMMPAEAAGNPEAKQAMEMMKSSMKATIELAADHTAKFHFEMPMAPKQDETGTWKLEGTTLTMTSKKGDKDETKTGKLEGGVISITEEQAGKKMTMTFKKQ